ncbi:MAG: hypothetical protein VXZ18_15235 [Pseudomonadota bacterium]|nr:hypothetical protein [Pseudomonadota bacterium]
MSLRPELHVTLTQILDALDGPEIEGAPITTEAHLDAAVEVSFGWRDGALVADVAPPASRFVSGIQNPVQRMVISAHRVPVEARETAEDAT